jgi:hypothetical protein
MAETMDVEIDGGGTAAAAEVVVGQQEECESNGSAVMDMDMDGGDAEGPELDIDMIAAAGSADVGASVGEEEQRGIVQAVQPFKVDDVMEYSSKNPDGCGETMELVTIKAVHYDNCPDIYYTVQFISDASRDNKQTDHSRLTYHDAASDAMGIRGNADDVRDGAPASEGETGEASGGQESERLGEFHAQ